MTCVVGSEAESGDEEDVSPRDGMPVAIWIAIRSSSWRLVATLA